MKKIIKRNGKIQKFKLKKIKKAIEKATENSSKNIKKKTDKMAVKTKLLLEEMYQDKVISSEEVANVVEEVLMQADYHAAKAFILYRDQQQRQAEITSNHMVDLVKQYLHREDWKVNENSNMGYSISGLNNYISSSISKEYWLNSIYPENIREAHKNGDLHIHDLGQLSAYCIGWDLEDLLKIGFCGVRGKTESKPPKHFGAALGQIVNFLYTLQNEAAGAMAFSSFDTLLAPFVYYDKLSYEQVRQDIQEFVFNMNVHTRQGGQCPFTNLTFDLQPSPNYKDQVVVVGGKTKKKTYGEFQKQMNMINKAFLEVMMEGDAKGRIFTFPIPTYNITKDFDWDNSELELLWKCTGKYGMPYFANYVNSDMKPEDAKSMCCRLRLDLKELRKKGGGLFGSNPLTGSIGVVTINMPRLGYLATDREEFIKKLDHLMFLAKESLEIKRKMIEKLTEENLYPYSKFYLRSVKKRFDKYWQNHFSTIGLVGMNEACINLLGEDIGSYNGKRFACRVLNHMRDKMIEFQKETGNNYNLEATPAESTAFNLALKDKEKYEHIVCANEESYREGAPPYYSNSTQLPVNYTDDLIEMLDLQDELQCKYTGGTVIHLFIGEKIEKYSSVKKLVKKVCESYHLPYISITPTFSICPQHGYLVGEQSKCPNCGKKCEIWSRVVGYLRPVEQWNKGKKEEYLDRKTYKLGEDDKN